MSVALDEEPISHPRFPQTPLYLPHIGLLNAGYPIGFPTR